MGYYLFKKTDFVRDPFYSSEDLIWVELYFDNFLEWNNDEFKQYREELFYNSFLKLDYQKQMVRIRVKSSDFNILKNNAIQEIVPVEQTEPTVQQPITNENNISHSNNNNDLVINYIAQNNLTNLPNNVELVNNLLKETNQVNYQKEQHRILMLNIYDQITNSANMRVDKKEVLDALSILDQHNFNDNIFKVTDLILKKINQGKDLGTRINKLLQVTINESALISIAFSKSRELQNDTFLNVNDQNNILLYDLLQHVKDYVNQASNNQVNTNVNVLQVDAIDIWINEYHNRINAENEQLIALMEMEEATASTNSGFDTN